MAKKILIVEDEESILILLSRIFSFTKEYQILLARDGKEALDIIQKDSQDIIILDILLPKLNGYELCKLLKSDAAMSQVKVLMLSGMTQESDLQKAREVGADACMTKPFSITRLVEKVEELLKSNL